MGQIYNNCQGKASKYIKQVESTDDLYPAFTFKYLQNGKYDLNSKKCTKTHKLKVLERINVLSNSSWSSLYSKGKEQGFEYLSKEIINASLPNEPFFNTIKKYVVFRLNDKGRIIGHRVGKIVYVLWFDWDFTLYNHGS